MILLDLTLPSPAENLALDEALQSELEASRLPREVLRFWESAAYFVVLGSSGKLGEEVWVDACERDSIPVLRRHSGGGTVLQGPGCLNYSLILSLDSRPGLHDIPASFRLILGEIRRGLAVNGLVMSGTSDLSIGGRKLSGNSQRRRRRTLLHHGTLLYDFDLRVIEKYLPHPPKEPAYRKARKHEDFLTNLPLPADTIKSRVAGVWQALPRKDYAPPRAAELAAEKYANPDWTNRF